MGFTGIPPAVSVGSSRLVEQSNPPTTAESGEKGWDSCPDWGACLWEGLRTQEKESVVPTQRCAAVCEREHSSLFTE